MSRGLDVQVLERQVVAGGNAISERLGGYLMEHGPTTFYASVPGASESIEALGLLASASDLGENVKRRYLRDQGRLSGISTHPAGFLMSNYLSSQGRLSVMLEALRPRRKATTEESIHDFASRRFGREFADKVIEPMAAGLLMGDSRKLSISGAFSRLAEMERAHGSIIRAVLKARKGSQPGRHLYSWENGIGTIPAKLAKYLGPKLRTGVAVLGLGRIGRGFLVKTNRGTIRSRAVVLAVQPHVTAALLDPLDPLAATAAGDIMAPPVNVVFLAYRREQVGHPLDGLGFLSTKDPACIVSGVQFQSTMYQGRAPKGHVAISTYAGGMRNPELAALDTATLVDNVHKELAETLGITGAPVLHRTRRWALGLPQYELGHPARVALLESTADRVPGLFITGNFLRGISVANCLDNADGFAGRVALTLRTHGQTRVAASGIPC
jgi:protoporphyrinogen/coproporphyrinogen III oxidase